MIYRNITSLFHVLVILAILNSVLSRACDLRKTDRKLVELENGTYIGRTERRIMIYRGISMERGEALDKAFNEVKKGGCVDLKEFRK